MAGPDWIAADWGTEAIRLWAMRGDTVVAQRTVAPDQPTTRAAEVLVRETADWGALPVIACGVPVADAPQKWAPAPARPVATPLEGGAVWLVEGIAQKDPPDVICGAETRIAGLLAMEPDFDGVVCLAGPQSTWVRVSAGEICHFQSFITGQLRDWIAREVLSEVTADSGVENEAFDAALAEALSRPERAYAGLFALRAGVQMGDLAPSVIAGRLWGALLGWELAGARPYWLGEQVRVIGTAGSASLYVRALAAQGVQCAAMSDEEAVLSGLISVRANVAAER